MNKKRNASSFDDLYECSMYKGHFLLWPPLIEKKDPFEAVMKLRELGGNVITDKVDRVEVKPCFR
uniref:Uncharacterized protein n=1 Tax=Salix viminalis TaxID=40686 RepID=A0A6N2KN31_SALVM